MRTRQRGESIDRERKLLGLELEKIDEGEKIEERQSKDRGKTDEREKIEERQRKDR